MAVVDSLTVKISRKEVFEPVAGGSARSWVIWGLCSHTIERATSLPVVRVVVWSHDRQQDRSYDWCCNQLWLPKISQLFLSLSLPVCKPFLSKLRKKGTVSITIKCKSTTALYFRWRHRNNWIWPWITRLNIAGRLIVRRPRLIAR